MAMAVTEDGEAEAIISRWEPAITASLEAWPTNRRALGAQLGAIFCPPGLRVTQRKAPWLVTQTWSMWPECEASLLPLCDIVILCTALEYARIIQTGDVSPQQGHRYLSLDRIFQLTGGCVRRVEHDGQVFEVLHLAGFEPEVLRALVTEARAEPPAFDAATRTWRE